MRKLSKSTVLTTALLLGATQAHAYTTMPTWQFDQIAGVDTHLNYGDGTYGSNGAYHYPLAMTEAQFLFGSNWPINFRDTLSNGSGGGGASPITYYDQFADPTTGFQRVLFTALVSAPGPMASMNGLAGPLILAQDVNASKNGSVPFIEGDNEAANASWPGDAPRTAQAVNDQAAALAALVKSSIANGYLPASTKLVFNTDWEHITPHDMTNPVTAGYASYDNAHPYPGFGSGPYAPLTADYSNGVNDPKFATEFGYPVCGLPGGTACSDFTVLHTGAQQWVDEKTREKYTLDAIMDASRLGFTKLFLYELENAYASGSRFSPWGLFHYDSSYTTSNHNLFNADGTPNTTYVSATAIGIHNLFSIISDTSDSLKQAKQLTFTARGLAPRCWAGSGIPTGTYVPCTTNEVFENANGNYFLVLWAEPQIWNTVSETEVTPPTQTVTLTLPETGFSTYQVYDPSLTSGATKIASGIYTPTLSVTVTDHPIIVELLK